MTGFHSTQSEAFRRVPQLQPALTEPVSLPARELQKAIVFLGQAYLQIYLVFLALAPAWDPPSFLPPSLRSLSSLPAASGPSSWPVPLSHMMHINVEAHLQISFFSNRES